MVASLIMATGASAQSDDLTEARAAYLRGDFEAAAAAYQAALASSSGLNRGTLEQALTDLAIVQHASRDTEGAEAALTQLLAIAPDAALPDVAPPSLRARFEELREQVPRLELAVRDEATADGARVVVAVIGDPGLVRSTSVMVRDGGGWVAHEGTSVAIPGDSTYYVEAHGPGGVVVARAGSADRPRTAASALGGGGTETFDDEDGEEGGASGWKWALAIGAVVVAGALATGLAIGLQDDSVTTVPTFPMPR